MDKSIQEQYKQLENKYLRIVDEHNILPIMAGADMMITDTSSVAYEFLSFDRPLITYQALARKDKGINMQIPSELSTAIEQSLMNPDEFSTNRANCLRGIHPYSDGFSSDRMLQAIAHILNKGLHNELKQKPLNILRKYQIRKMIARSQAKR